MTDPHFSYIRTLHNAQVHWHFEEAQQALQHSLYIPAITAYLAGIENSIRISINHLHPERDFLSEDLGTVLSNSLLREAAELGLPIETLAFPNENILQVITSRNPPSKLVSIRNDLNHGNINKFLFGYIENDEETTLFFTPECLREPAEIIERIAKNWAAELAAFIYGN